MTTVTDPLSAAAGAQFDQPQFYLDRPDEVFRELRTHDPVHWYDDGRFWVITKYDDIKAISARPQQFASERIAILMDLIAHKQGVEPQGYRNRGIMFLDPPVHRAHRRTFQGRFTPAAVARAEERVKQVVNEVFDALPDGEFDWIAHVAEPIPVYVFAYLLGVPEADWPKVAGWSTAISRSGSGAATQADFDVIMTEIGPYLLDIAKEKAQNPVDDDLMTMLATLGDIDGEPFDDLQIMVYALTLLAAGSETTQSLIAGIAECLASHPDQARALFDDPSLVDNAIEEVLRYWTPVRSMARQATHDVELRSKVIREGDGVLLAYGSANRDMEHFGETADQFDILRKDAPSHLGFGVGEHFCMGAALARREARLTLDEIVKRATGIEVTGQRVPRPSALNNNFDLLPVTLTRR